jgi:hypothetical protein
MSDPESEMAGAHAAGDTLGGDAPPDGTDGSLGADTPAGDAGLSGAPQPGDTLDQAEDALDARDDESDEEMKR